MMKYLSCALTFTLLVFPALAGDSPRVVRAVRVQSAPVIDGYLNEDGWKIAEPASDFIQRDPDEGAPASEKTEVRVLYDDDALYFGWKLFDAEPEKIVARLTRRDDEIESDRASIRIDAYHDHQTCYEFTFNAAGVKVDILQYDDGEKEDDSWDAVWDVETRLLPNGWSAELRIPFRILRYRASKDDSLEHEWGINFLRYISRKNEAERWAFVPKNESGFISRFGHVQGLTNLPSPLQIDVLPFIVGRQRFEPPRPDQDRIRKFTGDAGLDLKYSLSNSFTLDATVNPDFGQVEADPAVLNLSTFETFYPEKRPFFVEGTQILRFTTFGGSLGPGMFYSRRIGRAIDPDEVAIPPNGKVEELPQATTILGAAKINGKTGGGLSVGVLQAFTEEERATVSDSTGTRSEQTLEPFAHYNIVRLKQDILNNSNIGLILTSVEKSKRAPAITNGYDWYLKLDENTYLLEGFWAHTHANNSALERIHGTGGRINFSRVAAEHWLWSVGARYLSRKYNINDVGFFFRPDGYTGLGQLTYREQKPGDVVRSWFITLSFTDFSNMSGVNIQREAAFSSNTVFTNYWEVNFSGGIDMGRYDDRETRGNGLYRKPVALRSSLYVYSDDRMDVSGKLGLRYAWDNKLKQQWAIEAGTEVRPASWMGWDVNAEFERVVNQEAWVANVPDAGGLGSIFAERTTNRLDLTLRGTVTFTRDLTLQAYGQIFLAKGHHGLSRRLVGVADFIPSGYDATRRDFNAQTLNTNIVLRWEYLPGSTMFLVWSQARDGNAGDYFTSFGDDFGDTFRTPPANVFLLKVTYLLAL